MLRSLVGDMRCPYCGGAFETTVVGGDERVIQWGLLRCRCFAFPVVDGVLLLSLAKGYGGPEEELHPYVPLLVAGVEYLERGDVDGLRGWIDKHLPNTRDLFSWGKHETYLALSARLGAAIAPLVDAYLTDMARFEVIGELRPVKRRRKPPRVDRALELSRLADYYTTRFFSPRAHALALRMSHLPWGPRTLSLCCGHGVFENFVRGLGLDTQVVSVDAQLVNLLITRRYCNPEATLVLHDVQFPLPFVDGAFDGVFSSTCLPELPAQKTFVEESIRASSSWAFFDRTWNLEIGARRIEHARHYRFAQNFFERLEDYVSLFRESAGERSVGVDLAREPAAYLDQHGWAFGDAVDSVMASRPSVELSALVVDAAFSFVEPKLHERLRAERLSVSPAYEADGSELRRRPQVAHLDFAEGGRLDGDAVEQFCRGYVAFVPDAFDAG